MRTGTGSRSGTFAPPGQAGAAVYPLPVAVVGSGLHDDILQVSALGAPGNRLTLPGLEASLCSVGLHYCPYYCYYCLLLLLSILLL